MLFQVINILALYRSETLANYIKFESEALRASIEASALVAERERWEREKENMRHDREMWEKVPEDHIPPGARWGTVSYIYGCRAYGKREYEGVLLDIPKGWSAIDACMNTPVSIKVGWNRPKVEIRQPHRCASVGNSLHGYWIVDRDQDDCEPKLKDVHDTVSQRFPPVNPYSRSGFSGMYKLQVWSHSDRGPGRRHTGWSRARLAGDVRNHPVRLGWCQLHESYSLRGGEWTFVSSFSAQR